MINPRDIDAIAAHIFFTSSVPDRRREFPFLREREYFLDYKPFDLLIKEKAKSLGGVEEVDALFLGMWKSGGLMPETKAIRFNPKRIPCLFPAHQRVSGGRLMTALRCGYRLRESDRTPYLYSTEEEKFLHFSTKAELSCRFREKYRHGFIPGYPKDLPKDEQRLIRYVYRDQEAFLKETGLYFLKGSPPTSVSYSLAQLGPEVQRVVELVQKELGVSTRRALEEMAPFMPGILPEPLERR